MAKITRRTDIGMSVSEWKRQHNKKVFLRGALIGSIAAVLIATLFFVLFGPLLFGSKQEASAPSESSSLSQSSSQAESSSEPESSSQEPSSEEPSQEPSSEPSSVEVTTSKATSTKPTEVVSVASVPSPLNKKSPAYLVKGERQSDEFLADCLFIGDSITQGLELYLPDINTTVLGQRSLNPDSAHSSTSFRMKNGSKAGLVKAVASYKPKRVYIMIGTNGIAWMSHSYMYDRLGSLIDQIKKELPKATIILQSIPPVSIGKYRSDNRFSVKNIDTYNSGLLKLAETKKIEFLDINAQFRNEQGYLPTEETPDGIHFYKANYIKWINVVLTHTVANRDLPEPSSAPASSAAPSSSAPEASSQPEAGSSEAASTEQTSDEASSAPAESTASPTV